MMLTRYTPVVYRGFPAIGNRRASIVGPETPGDLAGFILAVIVIHT